MQASAPFGTRAVVKARVYRAHPCPRYLPAFVWQFFINRHSTVAGHWEDLGVIASSADRSLRFGIPPTTGPAGLH